MKRSTLLILMILILACGTALSAQTTAFTYQGSLTDTTLAANGTYDFQFALYDNDGFQVGPTVTRTGVNVAAGVFSVSLDFGSSPNPFANGQDLEMEISVRKPPATAYTTLNPLQPITSSPYAIFSSFAYQANVATNISGIVPIANGGTGSSTKNFVDLLTNQTIAGNKTFTGSISGNGSGLTGLSGANLADNSITAGKLADASVTEAAIRDGNVGTSKIRDEAITLEKLARNSVDTSKLVNGSVTTEKLADGAVTAEKIAPGAVFKWKVVTGTLQQAEPNTGYLATNAEEVTFSLPVGPNIGDTVRFSGGGVGGWKITQEPGQTMVVGEIDDGWTPREINRVWVSVASSGDGTKLVAVTEQDIYTSIDSGLSWVLRATPSATLKKTRDTPQLMPIPGGTKFASVASSADGNNLVAVVRGGQIYTSTDSGASWTARESNRIWTSVASSADGTKLVAVSGAQIYTSSDSGVEWTPRDSNRNWRAVASSADGTKLVAASFNDPIYTSTDSGVTWTPQPIPGAANTWVSVASSADGEKLVAVGQISERIFTSTNAGLSWSSREAYRDWKSVASSAEGNKLVAVATSGQIYLSNDSGVNWTPVESVRGWSSVASSADGEKLVATVNGGRIYLSEIVITSAGSLTGKRNGAIELQYVGAGRFILLSRVGPMTVY